MNRLAPDFFTGSRARIVLAPMEGVVDQVTRDILTAIGSSESESPIDLCVTEFIRVTDRLLPEHVFFRDAPELLNFRSHTPSGTPLLVQLLGSDPGALGENAARAIELGAVGIDLNFGCPAKTVNRHDGGAALLKDPSRIFKAVEGVRKAVPATHTVSAKVRLGFADKSLHREIAQAAADAGAAWLTVHARTRDEGYRPPAHWEFIGSMRECIDVPVIANGDVWTPEDYRRMLEITGCQHAMLGRGLLARPGLARECRGGPPMGWMELKPHISRFFAKSLEAKGPLFASARIKQWLKSLAKTYPEAVAMFEAVKRIEVISQSQITDQVTDHVAL